MISAYLAFMAFFFTLLFFITLYLLWKTATTDPGIIPRRGVMEGASQLSRVGDDSDKGDADECSPLFAQPLPAG